MKYKPTIGLEIHVELKTKTKMFCDSPNNPDEKEPNINVCPVCMGHPGTLPVINKEAVRKVLSVGKALGGKLADYSRFDRKNYFYPDLPKGYQISQYKYPLVEGGELNGVKITRIHLEEDTGRLIHQKDSSLVDFNRAGVPLMELVTEPDIKSGEEAKKFAEELQLILRYLDVSDADMEKGEMRIEANVSIRPNTEANVSIRPNTEQIKTNDKRIILPDDSYHLMGLIFEIHNKLGPIYKEKNYQDAIEEVFKREKIPYEREKDIELEFENLKVSDFFADFVVDNQILLEVKATKFITQEDIRQVLRYLKSLNIPLGIIINFRREKLEYKRLINPSFDFNSLSLVKNSGGLGVKVEIKNLNSFRAVEKAINYEIERQAEILDSGGKIAQETRGWDETKQITFSQREKEESHDYRYFPEPDLPPMQVSSFKFQVSSLPELPQQKRERFKKEFGLKDEDIETIIYDKKFADYFEEVASELGDKKFIQLAVNYLTSDLQGLMKESASRRTITFDTLLITPENFAELIAMISKNEISSRTGKDVLKIMFENGGDPSVIVDENGLRQKSDETSLVELAERIIKENPVVVNDYKKGKEIAMQFLIGQGMKLSKGSVNPELLKNTIKQRLFNNLG